LAIEVNVAGTGFKVLDWSLETIVSNLIKEEGAKVDVIYNKAVVKYHASIFSIKNS
jgi:hypothetical protein